MRTLRKLLMVLVPILGLLLVGACGGAEKAAAPAPAPKPAAPAPAPATAPAPAPPALRLLVYSTQSEARLNRFASAFKEETGIDMAFVSVGFQKAAELAARIESEAASPKGDVFFGGAPILHLGLKGKGLLARLDVPNLKDVPRELQDLDGFWTAYDVESVGIVVNTESLKKLGLPEPKSWTDLLNPAYKGQVLFPDPTTDNFGVIALAGLIQALGEEKAWEYIQKLHPQVARYPAHGEGPKLAAAGLFPITVEMPHHTLPQIRAGYTLKLIYPGEGTGYDIGVISLIKGGPNPEAAKAFVNWVLSRKGNQLHTDLSFRGSVRKDAFLPPGGVLLDRIKLVKMDFKWLDDNEKKIVEQWRLVAGK